MILRIRGQRGWVADRVDEGGTAELVDDFLLQLYAGADSDSIPREILVPALPPDVATYEQLAIRRSLLRVLGSVGACCPYRHCAMPVRKGRH